MGEDDSLSTDAEPAADAGADGDDGGNEEQPATPASLADGPSPGVPKRAIVYIPHLGHAPGQSIGDLATRLAAELDRGDADRSVRYAVGGVAHTVRFGRTAPQTTASSVTVVRTSPSGEETSIGVYEFSYSASFIERFDRRSALLKALNLLRTIVLNIGRLLRSFVRGRRLEYQNSLRAGIVAHLAVLGLALVYLAVDPRGRAVPIAIGLLVLLSAGAASELARRMAAHARPTEPVPKVLTATAAGTAASLAGLMLAVEFSVSWRTQTLGKGLLVAGLICLLFVWLKLANPDLGQRVQLGLGFLGIALMTLYAVLLVGAALGQVWGAANGSETDWVEDAADPLAGIAVSLTAFGVTFSPKEARARVADGATHLMGVIRYLSEGEGRDSETGRLYELVEHLAELGIESVDVVGYSFGSILALDALYRAQPAETPEGTRQVVKRLVTIGCPVVTVATFWPHYWEDRQEWTGEWINVYSPFDVLSSNLSERPARRPAGAEDGAGGRTRRHVGAWVTPLRPGASSPRPTQEREFDSGPSTRDLTTLQKLALAGLRAHANYWQTPYQHDPGAVAEFAYLWRGDGWDGSSGDPAAVHGQPES